MRSNKVGTTLNYSDTINDDVEILSGILLIFQFLSFCILLIFHFLSFYFKNLRLPFNATDGYQGLPYFIETFMSKAMVYRLVQNWQVQAFMSNSVWKRPCLTQNTDPYQKMPKPVGPSCFAYSSPDPTTLINIEFHLRHFPCLENLVQLNGRYFPTEQYIGCMFELCTQE